MMPQMGSINKDVAKMFGGLYAIATGVAVFADAAMLFETQDFGASQTSVGEDLAAAVTRGMDKMAEGTLQDAEHALEGGSNIALDDGANCTG